MINGAFSEASLGQCHTSKMGRFVKIVIGLKPLHVFAKKKKQLRSLTRY